MTDQQHDPLQVPNIDLINWTEEKLYEHWGDMLKRFSTFSCPRDHLTDKHADCKKES